MLITPSSSVHNECKILHHTPTQSCKLIKIKTLFKNSSRVWVMYFIFPQMSPLSFNITPIHGNKQFHNLTLISVFSLSQQSSCPHPFYQTPLSCAPHSSRPESLLTADETTTDTLTLPLPCPNPTLVILVCGP